MHGKARVVLAYWIVVISCGTSDQNVSDYRRIGAKKIVT